MSAPFLAACIISMLGYDLRQGQRSRSSSPRAKQEADRMLLSVGIAGLLPDVFKRLFDRKRPDRTVVHGPGHAANYTARKTVLANF